MRGQAENLYAAALFDFDYTLGDCTDGIVACVNHGLRGTGNGERGVEEIRRTVGHSLAETYFMLTGDGDGAHAARFDALFQEKANEVMTDSARLYPNAENLLRTCKKRGMGVGIVTTKHRYRIVSIFEKFATGDVADVIIGNEDVRMEKPHPEGLEKAAAFFGCGKVRVLYVGDSVVDAEAAQRAGLDFAAVLTGTTPKENFLPYRPVAVAKDLSALEAFLFH